LGCARGVRRGGRLRGTGAGADGARERKLGIAPRRGRSPTVALGSLARGRCSRSSGDRRRHSRSGPGSWGARRRLARGAGAAAPCGRWNRSHGDRWLGRLESARARGIPRGSDVDARGHDKGDAHPGFRRRALARRGHATRDRAGLAHAGNRPPARRRALHRRSVSERQRCLSLSRRARGVARGFARIRSRRGRRRRGREPGRCRCASDEARRPLAAGCAARSGASRGHRGAAHRVRRLGRRGAGGRSHRPHGAHAHGRESRGSGVDLGQRARPACVTARFPGGSRASALGNRHGSRRRGLPRGHGRPRCPQPFGRRCGTHCHGGITGSSGDRGRARRSRSRARSRAISGDESRRPARRGRESRVVGARRFELRSRRRSDGNQAARGAGDGEGRRAARRVRSKRRDSKRDRSRDSRVARARGRRPSTHRARSRRALGPRGFAVRDEHRVLGGRGARRGGRALGGTAIGRGRGRRPARAVRLVGGSGGARSRCQPSWQRALSSERLLRPLTSRGHGRCSFSMHPIPRLAPWTLSRRPSRPGIPRGCSRPAPPSGSLRLPTRP